jgi:hypothetical protein
MKKLLTLILSVLWLPCCAFAVADELFLERDVYKSITTTAEYVFLPRFEPVSKTANTLFEDIKVSAIEAVPFAVMYTFFGLFLYEANTQGTFQPKMKRPEDYKNIYFIAAGSLAAVSVFVNVFSFYDYSYKEAGANEKKAKKD